MKEKTCCFTGHRHIPAEYLPAITKKLRDTLIFYIEQGYQYFDAGGALGFDTLAAQTVLNLKAQYPDIKLILVLPCKNQASRWSETDVREYEWIKTCADKIVYTADRYFNGCMQKKEPALGCCSSLCICYLTEQSGGTKYTVDYATENGITVVNLAKK